MSRFAALTFAIVALAAAATTAAADGERFPLTAARNEWGGIELSWEIPVGHYLYRDRLAAEGQGGEAILLETPQGDLHGDVTFGEVEIYRHRATALVMDPVDAPFTVRWQGCEEGNICYPPESAKVDPVTLQVAPLSVDSALNGAPAFRLAKEEGLVEGMLSDGGAAWLVAGFLGLGLLLSFTPCVFPMYPIVAGLLAREGERLTPLRGLALSGTYALSLSAAFAAAGALAGMAGSGLSSSIHTPAASALLAVLFAAFAAAMFGAFEIALPGRLTTAVSRAAPRRRGSLGSAAALGLASSLILSPCVTAPLAGALAYVARTGDVALGAAALFALGIGKSLPLVALSAAGGGLLPKAGPWTMQVKHLFGFAFLAAAAWTAAPLLPGFAAPALTGAIALAFAAWAAHLLPAPAHARTGTALAAALYGVTMLAGSASGSTHPFLPMTKLPAAALTFDNARDVASVQSVLAKEEGKRPVMVYFTADWCVECLRLDRSLWPLPETAKALDGIRLVKADSSSYGPDEERLMREMKVKGPPTFVFFRNGAEVPGTRIEGAPSLTQIAASAERARETDKDSRGD